MILYFQSMRYFYPLEKAITKGNITTWLDAQHHQMDIAQRAEQQPAPHVVPALATMGHIRPLPTSHQEIAGVIVGAEPAIAQDRAGRKQVRPYCTRLPKYGRSRRFAKISRSERPCLTFGTYFFATRGTTVKGSPKKCTTGSSPAVSRFGSARKTSSSVQHYSAKSIRDW